MKPRVNSFPDAKILVIDDNIEKVQVVTRVLEWAGYFNVNVLTSSAEAVRLIKSETPDLVLLDVHMRKPDGYDVIGLIRGEESRDTNIPVLVYTADGSQETRSKALEAGASDFVTKPGDAQEILLRVKNFLRLRASHLELQRNNADLTRRVSARTAELSVARKEALEALAHAAELRDDSTGQHTRRVGELSVNIAKQLGAPEPWVDALGLAAPLHDVGKIGVPASILLKPGSLSEEEVASMRCHTTIGAQVFASIDSPLMKLAREIALSHHERWDGAGYPHGVAGDTIPLGARIVAVADVYDALVHERPYRSAWTPEAALVEIQSQSGAQFDPRVVDAFLAVMDAEWQEGAV
jgi:putative two-component system response regulator